jgi:hypothetical protein
LACCRSSAAFPNSAGQAVLWMNLRMSSTSGLRLTWEGRGRGEGGEEGQGGRLQWAGWGCWWWELRLGKGSRRERRWQLQVEAGGACARVEVQ